MKALLIVAHGSRSKDSNDEVARVAECIGEKPGPAFDLVAYAFLELASPKVDAAIAHLAEEGVTEIKVFPYFLGDGTHVANDVPRIIKAVRETYPDIHFDILPHLGALDGISALIFKHINKSTFQRFNRSVRPLLGA